RSRTTTASRSPTIYRPAATRSRSGCMRASVGLRSTVRATIWCSGRSRSSPDAAAPGCRDFAGQSLARQREAEGAASAGFAFGPDAAAVTGDDVLADVQTEAHAARAPGHRVLGLIEEAKHGFELADRDSDSRIADAEHDVLALVAQPDHDGATARRELD